MRGFIFKPQITNIFQEAEIRMPDIFDRINAFHSSNQPVRLIIDGMPRTGKSYTAKWIIEHYTTNYVTVFTIKQLLQLLKEGINHKWILFDEAELEAPSTEFRSANNLVLRLIVSSYGYLNNDLIMTTPSIYQIDKTLRHLITFRISMTARKSKNKISRIAWVKLPIWIESKMKYVWTVVEERHMPEIIVDENYEDSKRKNFLNALDSWSKRLSTDKEEAASLRIGKSRAVLERHKQKIELTQLRIALQQQKLQQQENLQNIPSNVEKKEEK